MYLDLDLDLAVAENGGFVSKLSPSPPVLMVVVALSLAKKSSVPLSEVSALQAILRLC